MLLLQRKPFHWRQKSNEYRTELEIMNKIEEKCGAYEAKGILGYRKGITCSRCKGNKKEETRSEQTERKH